MRPKCYTFFVASSDAGRVQKIRVPFYVVHLLSIMALVGCATVFAAVTSYTRMLWKVGNYNALRRDQDRLKKEYRQLQGEVKDTNQRLSSLQSLASEVAVTYGIIRLHDSPFQLSEAPTEPQQAYEHTLDQFNFLVKYPTAVVRAASTGGLRLLPGPAAAGAANVPSIWPVMGQITGSFGERLDPFSGEGAFHTGVDISAAFGEPVRATADGVVVTADRRYGYGRLVVIDHGSGHTTWYAHLSSFDAAAGARVSRGEVIGYVGISGRSTAPHVHYEVRLYNTPVNPWKYLRGHSGAD